MIRPERLALACALALFAATACAGNRGGAAMTGTVTVSVVRASAQCGGDQSGPSVRWIATQGELRAAMGAGGAFGAEPATPVDFKREGVVAIFMGQRPTGGYSVSLADPEVRVENGVATLRIEFREPPRGAMLTQVLTSPCLLVRMPGAGVREIRVVDPAGVLRASTPVRVAPQQPEGPPKPIR